MNGGNVVVEGAAVSGGGVVVEGGTCGPGRDGTGCRGTLLYFT